jgi:hypothetical protein
MTRFIAARLSPYLSETHRVEDLIFVGQFAAGQVFALPNHPLL